MPIPERQLKTWSHQGAVKTAKQTYALIKSALHRYAFPPGIRYEVYLQGSYKNNTNILGDSDVDLVVQLNSIFYSNLTEDQKQQFGFVTAGYGYQEFRSAVLLALKPYAQSWQIQQGGKSIKIRTPYLPADVVVCVQYRKYKKPLISDKHFVEGMIFYAPSEDRWVINYPKPHYHNGVKKNWATRLLYKPTVRMFKNARRYMIANRGVPYDLAPSYFLECLVYNVPNSRFSGGFYNTFESVLDWLLSASLDNFVCQNEQVLLFGDTPEQWSKEKAKHFLNALADLWNNWRYIELWQRFWNN